jgi:2-oxoisovalerate dehydrogenase E1 component
MDFAKYQYSPEEKILLYKQLVKPRLIEEKMLILLRQGKVSKWFSGIGQEAISVGCAAALHEDEKIFTMHRNLGVFTTRNMPLYRLFSQWQGKANGYTKGRDRSFHFGAPEHSIIGMISHLGPQLSLAAGVALAHKLSGEGKVSLAFTGEGGTSQGEFHEALNTAAVWKLPVIFVIENNGYGLSTPVNEQYACEQLADRAAGYGMKSVVIDGNNILEVYDTIRNIAGQMRNQPEPWLVEAVTFRMRGHEEASGTKYVPKELMDMWALKDPIENFEKYLLQEGVLTTTQIEEIQSEIRAEIDTHYAMADAEPAIQSSEAGELADVYAPYEQQVVEAAPSPSSEKRFVDAVSMALDQAMAKHSNLVLMGQDIAEYGGVFKVTQGLVEKYGKDRVRNTPLCESAIIGIALGASLNGYKSMVEMQFADFVTCGFNQIVNNLAKLHYRWGANADVVIRMPSGGGVAAGPFHSQSNEAWFAHTPGLKVLYPATVYDAKGMLLAAFEDPNPVMFFEHKALYRQLTDHIPDGYYTVEIGKASVARKGTDCTIITYGMGVHWALKLASEINYDIEVLDLRTLLPLDYEAIGQSVRKTGRVLILHEDTLFGGLGGEISAYISEHHFEYLDAPVVRAAGLDTPIPFTKSLEDHIFMPVHRLKSQFEKLMAY